MTIDEMRRHIGTGTDDHYDITQALIEICARLERIATSLEKFNHAAITNEGDVQLHIAYLTRQLDTLTNVVRSK